MNAAAKAHLAKANEYVDRGEQFYRKAAAEIIAAMDADPSLSYAAIGAQVGRDRTWVAKLVTWSTNVDRDTASPTPFSGEAAQAARDRSQTRKVLRDSSPEQLKEIIGDLPPAQRAAVVRAAVPPPERTERAEQQGPTFIEMLVRINGSLIELEAMVAGWQNPAAVPAEFSRDSFGDIVSKALRIQDTFDKLVAATDDEDEFQKIVRNFRVATDVR